MVKFVLDADGAIKLAKAGLLDALAKSSVCIMPQEVYKEVLKGKESMFEDAFTVEALVSAEAIKVPKHAYACTFPDLGAGENAAAAVFKAEKADAIISDDLKFLKNLQSEHIQFITPADAIIWLSKKRKLTKAEGLNALKLMKKIIRKEAYERAKSSLGGE